MADFNSNFNDIQKQIAVADLTEEQIQELMNFRLWNAPKGYKYAMI